MQWVEPDKRTRPKSKRCRLFCKRIDKSDNVANKTSLGHSKNKQQKNSTRLECGVSVCGRWGVRGGGGGAGGDHSVK